MRISDWSSDVCSSDLAGASAAEFAKKRARDSLMGCPATAQFDMAKSFLAPLYQSWSITNADDLGGFWMNLRQLEAFRAVMVTRSITQAAQSMHLSQPAVSKLIADLEYAIGFKLFVRTKGSALTVTPEAEYFYHEVERSFIGVRSEERRVGKASCRERGCQYVKI